MTRGRDPGEFSELLVLQEASDTSDGMGGRTRSWGAVSGNANIWGSVTPLAGREPLVAQQAGMLQAYEIWIYARSDITTRHRLLWGSRVLNILSVGQPRQGDVVMSITAEEADPV